ncbi:hypothetical protein LTR60_000885 [Cryomyces antarcticus]|nr:hypothetical protein LTR60_000885 [Cryomyces antarcticus]
MSSTASNPPTDARERLRQHFLDHPHSAHTTRWDDLWAAGDFLPWDRGGPNPALVDILRDRQDLVGTPTLASSGRRKRALVPGCGKGYDVLLLASWGYDAYGVESSRNAVKACEEYAARSGGDYPVVDKEVGKGKAKFLFGDFFEDGWFEGVEKEDGEDTPVFELIYDYTFLSALPPDLRPAWALRLSQLLSPSASSNLICLEFPTYKPPNTGGPPWALPPAVYVQHLSRPGDLVSYGEDGHIEEPEDPPKRNEVGLVRIAHWQPEHTHEIGKGTDWVGVWRHK